MTILLIILCIIFIVIFLDQFIDYLVYMLKDSAFSQFMWITVPLFLCLFIIGYSQYFNMSLSLNVKPIECFLLNTKHIQWFIW